MNADDTDDARAAPAFDDDAFFASADELDALAWLEEIGEIDAADAARWSVADDGRAATSRLDDEPARVDASPAEPALAPECEPYATPLTDCVVWLERNYRFGLDSPIGRLSLAIRRGAVNAALGALAFDPAEPCAAALYEDAGAGLAERTVARLAQGFAPYAQALGTALAERTPDPAPLFDALNRFRILCATRAGSRGVDQLNMLMAAQVRRAARVALGVGASWFAGRPVMVARNDYALGLFNGDIGIALPGADGALRVFFRTADGGLRAVSPAALPPHDTAFALTVHKSQGSEFDHAVLVLPPAASRVLSRELVYTAVTRARLAVEVIGSAAVLRQAIATQTRRDSGLAARIAEALRDLE
jgi:exodeoxyribonuclease V alpha subunit